MSNFTFDSRETYLQYRKEWKASYASLTKQIQMQRQKFKDAQRAFSLMDLELAPAPRRGLRQFTLLSSAMSIERFKLTSLRTLAFEALEELILAKKEASAQYRKRKMLVN